MRSHGGDLRIQLEGGLELVEVELDRWREALAGLDAHDWRRDARWRSMPPPAERLGEAVSALRDRSGEGDETLVALKAAQIKVRTRALARLTEFNRTSLDDATTTADVLRALEEEVLTRTLVEGWGALHATWRTTLSVAALGAAVGYLVTSPESVLVWVIAVSLVALAWQTLVFRRTERLLLSNTLIRVRSAAGWVSVPRAPLRRLQLTYESKWALHFYDDTGEAKSIEFDESPIQLVNALRIEGISVEIHEPLKQSAPPLPPPPPTRLKSPRARGPSVRQLLTWFVADATGLSRVTVVTIEAVAWSSTYALTLLGAYHSGRTNSGERSSVLLLPLFITVFFASKFAFTKALVGLAQWVRRR
jgi:hypothetical protein